MVGFTLSRQPEGNVKLHNRSRLGSVTAVAIVAASVTLATGITSAWADDGDTVVDALQGPNPALDSPVAALETDGGGAVAETEDVTISLPESLTDSVSIVSTSGVELELNLPFADTAAPGDIVADGLYAYDNANGSTTVPIAREDGFLQITTVIEDATAPTRYEYSFDVAGGATVEAAAAGAIVRGADGAYLAAIAAPWAVDATGAAVSTYYAVEGGALVQYVLPTESTVFPVVADPSICGNIWTGIVTSSYLGQPMYSLHASVCGTAIKTGAIFGGGAAGIAIGQQVMINAGWSEAVGLVPALTSKTSLRQQYDCHTIYGIFKDPWNLEKVRSNNSGWPGNPQQCNWP